MGGRYLVSGAELGMIAGFAKSNECDEVQKIVHEITDSNYLLDSQESIENDIQELRKDDEPMWKNVPNPRECPKCGSTYINTRFVEKGKKYYSPNLSEFLKKEPIWEISSTKQFYELNRNILLVHCRDCQYDWWEVPLDER